jgi:hypothetical protein
MKISIDFDGTITKSPEYPGTGEIADGCVEAIKTLYEGGHKLILNTCRTKEQLNDAIMFLNDHKILKYFYKINENCPKEIELYGGDCRKISADIYLDDKNIGGFPGWHKVEDYVYLLTRKEK